MLFRTARICLKAAKPLVTGRTAKFAGINKVNKTKNIPNIVSRAVEQPPKIDESIDYKIRDNHTTERKSLFDGMTFEEIYASIAGLSLLTIFIILTGTIFVQEIVSLFKKGC